MPAMLLAKPFSGENAAALGGLAKRDLVLWHLHAVQKVVDSRIQQRSGNPHFAMRPGRPHARDAHQDALRVIADSYGRSFGRSSAIPSTNTAAIIRRFRS